jgi:hypothetical protein
MFWQASVGSVIGVLLVDWLARKGGEKGLERFVSRQKVEQLKQKIENQAGITVLLATLIPPPVSFHGGNNDSVSLAVSKVKTIRELFLAVELSVIRLRPSSLSTSEEN